MRRIFADAVYWVAIAHRKDQWHAKAVQVSQQIGTTTLVTTDEVLAEFLNHFSAYGDQMRVRAAGAVRNLLHDATVQVRPQSRPSFLAVLVFYEARRDKHY